eukprot:4409792-Amphidinium_carterae.2
MELKGGCEELTGSEWHLFFKRRLLAYKRFQADSQYTFWLFEVWLKKHTTGSLGAFVKRSSSTSNEVLKQQVYTVLRAVPGTAPFLYAKRSMALRFIATLGRPRWFLTLMLTCHERQPWLVFACAVAHLRYQPEWRFKSEGEVFAEAMTAVEALCTNEERLWKGTSALQLMQTYPAVVAREFHGRVLELLRWLQGKMPGDEPPFLISDFVFRVEWQQRGAPHAHMLLWAPKPKKQLLPEVDGLTGTAEAAAAKQAVVQDEESERLQKRMEEHMENDGAETDEELLQQIREHVAKKHEPTIEELYLSQVCTTSPWRWEAVYGDHEMKKLAGYVQHHHSKYTADRLSWVHAALDSPCQLALCLASAPLANSTRRERRTSTLLAGDVTRRQPKMVGGQTKQHFLACTMCQS